MLNDPNGGALEDFELVFSQSLDKLVVSHEFDQLEQWLKEADQLIANAGDKPELRENWTGKMNQIEEVLYSAYFLYNNL